MTKGRLEAFSDGVMAIIITIMVLELKVPHGAEVADLWPLTPVLLSYVLSFVYLGIYWNNHHHLLHAARQVDGRILWANLHLLFWLSLVPFVTGWMGENHFASLPVALYGVRAADGRGLVHAAGAGAAWRATARTRCSRRRSAATSRATCRSPRTCSRSWSPPATAGSRARSTWRWRSPGSCPTCASSARSPPRGGSSAVAAGYENARPEIHAAEARTLPARYYTDPELLPPRAGARSTTTCGCTPGATEQLAAPGSYFLRARRRRERDRAARRATAASPPSTTSAATAARCCASEDRGRFAGAHPVPVPRLDLRPRRRAARRAAHGEGRGLPRARLPPAAAWPSAEWDGHVFINLSRAPDPASPSTWPACTAKFRPWRMGELRAGRAPRLPR